MQSRCERKRGTTEGNARRGCEPAGRIVDFYLLSISLIVSQFLRSGDLAGLNAVIEIVALLIGLS